MLQVDRVWAISVIITGGDQWHLRERLQPRFPLHLWNNGFLLPYLTGFWFWKGLCYYGISQWVRRLGVVTTRCPTMWYLPGNLPQSPQEAELLRLQLMSKDPCTCSSFVHQFVNSKNIDWATPKCPPLREEAKWDLVLKSTQTSETEKQVIKCISNNSYRVFGSYCTCMFSHLIF